MNEECLKWNEHFITFPIEIDMKYLMQNYGCVCGGSAGEYIWFMFRWTFHLWSFETCSLINIDIECFVCFKIIVTHTGYTHAHIHMHRHARRCVDARTHRRNGGKCERKVIISIFYDCGFRFSGLRVDRVYPEWVLARGVDFEMDVKAFEEYKHYGYVLRNPLSISNLRKLIWYILYDALRYPTLGPNVGLNFKLKSYFCGVILLCITRWAAKVCSMHWLQ